MCAGVQVICLNPGGFFAGCGEDSPWLSSLQVLAVSCAFLNHVPILIPEVLFPRSAWCL